MRNSLPGNAVGQKVLIGLAVALLLAGCDSKGASPTTVQLTPSSVQSLERGQTIVIAASVINAPDSEGVTWSLVGAGSLAAETPSSVVYQAPPDTVSPVSAKVTATVKGQAANYSTLALWLAGPLTILSKSDLLPPATTGLPYSDTRLKSSGGVGPYDWSIVQGKLPPGMVVNRNGTISGTPEAAGNFDFTVQVKDAENFTATGKMKILVSGLSVRPRKKVLLNM